MPDRFADGDPGNDDPPRSKGLFDRAKKRYYHGGDLKGIIGRLPYLKDLGVTALWLTPVYDNNDRPNEKERPEGEPITDYHGYGAVDFYAVDEHLGDLATLRELVEAAHRPGIAVGPGPVRKGTDPVLDPRLPRHRHNLLVEGGERIQQRIEVLEQLRHLALGAPPRLARLEVAHHRAGNGRATAGSKL